MKENQKYHIFQKIEYNVMVSLIDKDFSHYSISNYVSHKKINIVLAILISSHLKSKFNQGQL